MMRKTGNLPYIIAVFIGGLVLNLAGSSLMELLHLPLYLDCVGTMLASALGGIMPGVLVGYISNVIGGITDPTDIYFTLTSVLIALATEFFYERGYFKRAAGCVSAILVFALIGGGIGSCITWLLFGTDTGDATSLFAPAIMSSGVIPAFWAQFISDMLIDILDKTLQVLIFLGILRLIPQTLRERFRLHGWKQTPLSEEQRRLAKKVETRGWRLGTRILAMISAAAGFIAVSIAVISIILNQRAITEGYSRTSVLIRIVILFIGFFLLVLGVGLWAVEYSILLPVYAMMGAADEFAFNSTEARVDSVERFADVRIRTGDELENLYTAFSATIASTVTYLEEAQYKTQAISRMQNGLIMVLADLVESRDKCTGDHVRKTAAYVRIILEQLQEEGVYPGIIDPIYIDDVSNSAPLHDVGKIAVPDSILNKPGKLTAEEFEQMKQHTVAGREVIDKAISLVSDSGYLEEARNLASCHHEKWNGTGYPYGLRGEDIPLSARVMAVADVFDALVSRRSYKEPFPYDKAVRIIEEGAGSHFDPKVVEAFLHAQDKVKEVYKTNME
ncbi:MAG: HD domain-containing protein [Lachnospiraceae bacterium]|nr:HD domain-containing protein [Lachnospiraceae bacterium]